MQVNKEYKMKDNSSKKAIENYYKKIAAMTPEKQAARKAKLARWKTDVAEMIEGLNNYTAKK